MQSTGVIFVNMSKRKTLVVQHNKLIQGNYKTTLQEKRLILWLMSQIQATDKDFKRYTLKISDFAKMLGIEANHNLYAELQKITKNLLSKVISLELPRDKQLIQASFFSSAIYKYGTGTVEFSFDPALKPYLLELNKHFTSISLSAVIRFSSFYSIRIYELLKQYAPIGARVIDVRVLRSYLGISDSEYKLYASFKNRILKIAQREMNTKSDLFFDYQEIKVGRKVQSIRFILRKNAQFQRVDSYIPKPVSVASHPDAKLADNTMERDILHVLVDVWGISKSVASCLIEQYSESYIKNIIESVKTTIGQREISNVSGYLTKAIRNNWKRKSSHEAQQSINAGKLAEHIDSATNEIWRLVLTKVLRVFGEAVYISWFTKLSFSRYKDNVLYLRVQSSFVKSYIEDHYAQHLQKYWNTFSDSGQDKVIIERVNEQSLLI